MVGRSGPTPRKPKGYGLALISLGVSILFAAVAFAYFALQGDLFTGTGFALLIVVAGVWEFRRRLVDARTAEELEADAEERRERNRG